MERLDLTKILKDCPKGTTLYSPMIGELSLEGVYKNGSACPILAISKTTKGYYTFTSDGRYYSEETDAECILFPSKDCRDWAQFKQSKKSEFKKGDHILWYNTFDNCFFFGVFDKYTDEGQCVINLFEGDHLKSVDVYIKDLVKVEKFDTKWLKTGDEVLVRDRTDNSWQYAIFSHISQVDEDIPFNACGVGWKYCIPYNFETKHLVGTKEAAPEFYDKC